MRMSRVCARFEVASLAATIIIVLLIIVIHDESDVPVVKATIMYNIILYEKLHRICFKSMTYSSKVTRLICQPITSHVTDHVIDQTG